MRIRWMTARHELRGPIEKALVKNHEFMREADVLGMFYYEPAGFAHVLRVDTDDLINPAAADIPVQISHGD
jgi:hypothetical protein